MKTAPKLIAGFLLAGAAQAEPPHIGYAYPAGGQQGSSFRVMVGGQHLQGSTNVFVNGKGVTVEIVKFTRKYEPRRLRNIWNNRRNILAAIEEKEKEEDEKELEKLKRRLKQAERQLAVAELPEGVDIDDWKAVQRAYKIGGKEQFNPQIADRLRMDITISQNAPPGVRELRVYTPGGLSNPIYFQVGTLAEVREAEPNDDHMSPKLRKVPVPCIVNGQIRPGDIDHFRFKAHKGQSIVVDVGARRITPYLADAVPGWFQAVVALYDEEGHEVAYQDDYKFNPDPVLFFDVPVQGTYTLSIKDSIYRGREDFVYRIAIGELPFITSLFPLGAQQGREVDIALAGKNLPQNRLAGTLPDEGGDVRHISVKKSGYRSNPLPFAIGSLPEAFEIEPNNSPEEAQPVEQPLVVNGRIQQVGDVDVFSFQGKEGNSVSIEVTARRLNSPLDSTISLTGPGIDKPVRNDDRVESGAGHLFLGSGLVTHHADSYLLHTLPATGTYHVQIGDTQAKGGRDYGYRLRIGPALPDFKLRMEPSGVHIAPGGTAAFTVRALRLDGFNEKIHLDAKNLPEGFEMSEAAISAGSDTTRFTITAPRKISKKAFSPEITGMALLGDDFITRSAVPVDDQMQAFLYRHLVPAQELVLAPVAKPVPLAFEVELPESGTIELPLGEETMLFVTGRFRPEIKGAKLVLDHPPEGITVVKSWIGRKKAKGKTADGKPRFEKGVAHGRITLKVEEPIKPGFKTSLVVVAVVKKGREESRYPAPAIPIEVVKPSW
ncbi:MAG: hypothetical protein DRP64_09865 [Verrucomicrobia bacterium]|nr:MAG: hypothetical protein DRP64_09865 [Verrucomicrobiota bacterium]